MRRYTRRLLLVLAVGALAANAAGHPVTGGAKQTPLRPRNAGPVAPPPPAGPTVSAAYWSALGGDTTRPLFVILPAAGGAQWPTTVVAQGANLTSAQWFWHASSAALGTSGRTVPHGSAPNDGTYATIDVPSSAADGVVCAASHNVESCAPESIVVLKGPTISKLPPSPYARFTTLTIEGTNLLPPPPPVSTAPQARLKTAGLSYEPVFTPLDPRDIAADNVACNRAVQILEHTATRITFRIGDPAATPQSPATGTNGRPCWPNPSGLAGKFVLGASYSGSSLPLTIPVDFVVKP